MVDSLVSRGKKILTTPQSSILSAAFVIMLMNVVSVVFGIIRQRVLLVFFDKDTLGFYLAAFRLPDMVFELFAFGMFSAAFIPVFTKTLKRSEKDAWDMAARVMNLTLLIFAFFAVIFAIFARQFYQLVTPTFMESNAIEVVTISRILFVAQGFFVVSYILSGVLESMRRFLIPAVAPLFYNLGIILGAVLLTPKFGLAAPAIGAVFGAFAHMLIQLPFALHLGFRIRPLFRPTDDVKKVGKLALPRFFELGILQILKTGELFFASIISVASYTYLYLANALQVVPISFFAVAIAKASLPTLTRQEDDPHTFRKTFLSTFNQMMYIVVPIAAFLMVLRIPIVRLIYGTDLFDWEATVQTGMVLTSFAIGIPFQAGLVLLSRAFYAIHDTKTPVLLAVFDVVTTIILDILFVLVFHLPVWSIALANTLAGMVSFGILYTLLSRKMGDGSFFSFKPILRIVFAATVSGGSMFFLLKLFDRSVWVKRLSFLSGIGPDAAIAFPRFVLDTRYTLNLIVLTFMVGLVGAFLYLGISFLLKSEELLTLVSAVKRGRSGFAAQRAGDLVSQPDSTSG